MTMLFEKRILRITFYVLLFCAIALATFTTAFAQDTTPTDDEVNAIAKQLYCPVCQNTPLDVCPTEACRQWRELIRDQLAEGKTEAEIKQYFVANYGERVLAEPTRTGFNWLVYIIPPVLILAGAVMLFNAFRAWTKPKAVEAGVGRGKEAGTSSSDDEYIKRLEEELKNRK
ncbi:MAG: cytochrome c-type biosis protein CcmH [Chloroflexota bacterium]